MLFDDASKSPLHNTHLSLQLRRCSIAAGDFVLRWRTEFLALGSFLLLSLFDALCGGGISAGLRVDGWWSTPDQAVNDFYQLGFGCVCGAMMLYVGRRDRLAGMILLCWLLGYVEDTFYYLLQPIFSPIFEWRGLPPAELQLPEYVAGWIGWCSRVLHAFIGTPEIRLNQLELLLLNVAVIALSVWMWLREKVVENEDCIA